MVLDVDLQNRILGRIIISSTGCWEWQGSRHPSGYGRMNCRRYRTQWAHRLSFIAFTGDNPIGFSVCHSCDNPPCVSPNHLFRGTAKDNADDMMRKMRHPFALEAIKTHCKNGHPLSGENLKINRYNGQRVCGSCLDVSRRKWLSHQDPEALRLRQNEACRRYATKRKEGARA